MLIELLSAKLAALSVGAKVAAATATAASVVAVGGATGVVPVLPESAPASAESVIVDSEVSTDTAEPAPQAEFGQKTAEDARDGGVNGREIAEERSGRTLPEQATTGTEKAAEARTNGTAGQENAEQGTTQREQATEREQGPAAGPDAAEDGAGNGDAGRQTADNAPVNEDAPNSTPAGERAPGRG